MLRPSASLMDSMHFESSLLKLPAELRARVYEYVLGSDDHGGYMFMSKRTPELIYWQPNRLALLQTCRQVCKEAIWIFYDTNRLCFNNIHDLYHFASRTSSERVGAIRDIVVRKDDCAYNRENDAEGVDYWSALLRLPRLKYLRIEVSKQWALIFAIEPHHYICRAIKRLRGLSRLEIMEVSKTGKIARSPESEIIEQKWNAVVIKPVLTSS